MAIGKKIIKTIIISLIILALLIGAGITLLVTTVDQNMIKKQAVQLVYNKTGRKLNIAGDISWTFFPWLGVKIEDVSLSNPPDFKDKNFAKAKEIDLSIKLLPLISKNIEIGNLAIRNLELNLIKNRSGKANWKFAPKPDNAINSNNTPSQATKAGKEIDDPSDLSIANLIIDNSNISWQDLQTNKKIKVKDLNLQCKKINLKKPFTIKTSFSLIDSHPIFDINVKASTKATLDIDHFYKLENLQLTGDLKNRNTKKISGFSVASNFVLDQKKGSFSAKNLDIQVANANAEGSLQGNNIFNTPSFSGNLAIDAPDLKEVAQILELDKFTKNITNASLKADLEAKPSLTKLSITKAVINDMTINGDGSYAENKINFNLALNKLDTSFFDNKSATKKTTAKPHAAKTGTTSNPSPKAPNKIKLNGKVKIGIIEIEDLHIDNFATNVSGTTTLLNCQNITFDFYQGKGFGSALVNLRGNAPALNIKMALKNTRVKPLLIDLAKYKKFSGNFSLDTNISMRGNTANQMTQSLNGSGNILMTHGSYLGVDVPYEVRKAHSMLNMKPMPQKTNPPHTDFDRLTSSFGISNGVLNTNDLLILAPDYKVTGKGTANLATQNLNISLSAYSVHDKNFFVPIRVTGPFADPSIRPDTAILLQDTVKKVIKGVGKDIIEKALPDKIKDMIPGGFF